jgi:cellulose synthase operon protein C
MNLYRSIKLVGCLLAVVATISLAGCSKDAASYLASARSYIGKADYKSAIIEVKNALQTEPDNGDARVLLATALLESGDAAGAETEVRKAMALRMPADRTHPLLARSLLTQGQFKKLASDVDDQKIVDPIARADLRVSLALAALQQGDIVTAKALADAALADDPKGSRSLLLKAQLAGLRGDIAAARQLVETAIKQAPGDENAWMMKANLALAEGKPDEARTVFQELLGSHPSAMQARSALFALEMKSGKPEAAKEQLAKMKEIQPRDVRVVYADALFLAASGDNAHAKEAIQRVLAVRPQHLPSLLLSGLIDYNLGSYASSEQSLRTVIAKAPDEAYSRRLLSLILLRTGRAAQAVDTVNIALQRNPESAVLLRTAGEAYLASGNVALAAQVYERANAIDNTNLSSQVRLAQVRLAAGDSNRAFSDLESLAERDSTGHQAELALFSEHMRRRQYDKAMEAVDALDKKQPKSAMVANMRGLVFMAKRDLKNARANFEKALQIEPGNVLSAQNLGIIDLREGSAAAALSRYERMLSKDPKSEPLLLASAQLLTITGGSTDKARTAIDKAVSANPSSAGARLALIKFEMRRRDFKAATTAAQAALAAVPNHPQLTEALGVAQLAAGQSNQAVETFRKLVQLQPSNPLALLGLAGAQSSMKDYNAAIDSERKALALKPDMPQALAALTKTYIVSGRPDAAIAEARRLQKEKPDKAVGYALEGEILAAQKKWPEAARAFNAAVSRQPVSVLVARQYAVLQNAGKASEATALANKWVAEHPTDPVVPLMLAEQHQRRKDLPAALAGYKKVLEIDSDNIVALNNTAWILAEQKDPKSVEFAEEAYRLAPFNARIVDTLGWSLLRSGEAKRSVDVLRMATRLAQGQSAIRLHLAKALAEAGDKAGARQEIAELTKLDKASPIRIEAEKLQATL